MRGGDGAAPRAPELAVIGTCGNEWDVTRFAASVISIQQMRCFNFECGVRSDSDGFLRKNPKRKEV